MKMIPQVAQLQQGGGSIIINRLSALKPAVTDPSIYNSLPTNCKLAVDAVYARPPGSWTHEDVTTIATMPSIAVHCDP